MVSVRKSALVFDMPLPIFGVTWPHGFFFGILLAGVMTALIPENMFSRYLGGGLPAMLVMLALGIPLYICATASTPIAAALILKGVSPGAALVFLLAGPATNMATLTVLVGILGKRATAIYLACIAVCAVAFGLLLDQGVSYRGPFRYGHGRSSIRNNARVGGNSGCGVSSCHFRKAGRHCHKSKSRASKTAGYRPLPSGAGLRGHMRVLGMIRSGLGLHCFAYSQLMGLHPIESAVLNIFPHVQGPESGPGSA